MLPAQTLILLIEYARSREASISATETHMLYTWQKRHGKLSFSATLTLSEEEAVLRYDGYLWGKTADSPMIDGSLGMEYEPLFTNEKSITSLKEALTLEFAFFRKLGEWL